LIPEPECNTLSTKKTSPLEIDERGGINGQLDHKKPKEFDLNFCPISFTFIFQYGLKKRILHKSSRKINGAQMLLL